MKSLFPVLAILVGCQPAVPTALTAPPTYQNIEALEYWVGYDVRDLPSGMVLFQDTNVFFGPDDPAPEVLEPGKAYFFLNGDEDDVDQTIRAIECG